VTLLVPTNFPVNDKRVSSLKYNSLTKEEIGHCNWKKFSEAIVEVGDNYDVIVLNSPELSLSQPKLREKLREICPKFRIIYHHYDDMCLSSFFVTTYQAMAWVISNGGEVYTVSKLFDQYIRERFNKDPNLVKSNPHHYVWGETGYIPGFQWLDMSHIEDMNSINGDLSSNGDYVMVGRASKEKNLLRGIQAFVKSGVNGDLHVFTCLVKNKKGEEYLKQVMEACSSERVYLHLSAERGEIFETLRKSSILIFPSSKESYGLVPFEGASCGCRVIHKCPHSFFLDSDYDVEVPSLREKDLVQAIRDTQIPTIKEKEERREAVSILGDKTKFAKRFELIL
jgi:glycosyltransferase involved in cell wall biosynthesis